MSDILIVHIKTEQVRTSEESTLDFITSELLRDIFSSLLRAVRVEIHHNRADQFGLVSASLEIVVSMFS